jgi:DNA-binding CsgD family transcriptional regulator
MKVRLVLPALSLLLLLCGAVSWAKSTDVSVQNSIKTSDKQLLAYQKADANSVRRSTFASIVQATETVNGLKKAPTEISGAQTTETASFNEFSYNTIKEVISARGNNAIHSIASYGASGFPLGLYYGFTLAVLLLNGICYFLFEEKLFLYFGLALVAFGSMFFVNDGLLLLLGDISLHTPTVTTSLLFLGVACLSIFSHYYLKVEEHFQKLKYINFILLCIACLFTLPNWVTPSETLLGVANAALLTILANYVAMGLSQFGTKNYSKLFVIASTIPLFIMIDYFVFQPLGISFIQTGAAVLKAAFLVQALLLSYAIVYRMRALREETEMRQTEMRIFLKRQEMLNRENVAKLMQDVYLENLIMQHDLDGLEIKLLQYISEGKDNEKIARKLKLSEEEIVALTKELYHKLEIGEQIKQDYRMVDQQPDYIYN